MDKKLKGKIEQLEERHSFIANNLIDAIWVVDAETMKFEYVTPSIEKISGYTPEEYMGLTVQDRLPSESFEDVKHILSDGKKRFAQGINELKTIELELFHKDGHPYWIEARVRLYKDSNKPLKIIGIIREITERKKAEDIQSNLIKRLKNTLEEKERLLAENKVLRGLLPICSGCKRIRDENGKWWPLDFYITKYTDTEITHSICPDCTDVIYGVQEAI